MRTRILVLFAALAVFVAAASPAAAAARPWTYYHHDNNFPAQPMPEFCGVTNLSVVSSGFLDEWDAPRTGNTVRYRFINHTKYVWTQLDTHKVITVRYDLAGEETDTINPAWSPAYDQPWYFAWPEYAVVHKAGVIESLTASDGAVLADVGAVTVRWHFTQDYGYAEPPTVSAVGRMPIVTGPFDVATGLWTRGCEFFRAHLS